MTTPTVLSEYRRSELVWDFMRLGLVQRILSLAGFGVVYSLLVMLGVELRENSQQLTIIWPAAGMLFMALWLSPRRNWPWILLVQIAVEIALGVARTDHFNLLEFAPFPVANSIDATVGAFMAQRLIKAPEVPQLRQVL